MPLPPLKSGEDLQDTYLVPTITTNYNKNHFSNLGKNNELLLKCKILGEYSSFVDCVRKYSKINNDFTIAIDKAVNRELGAQNIQYSDIVQIERAEEQILLKSRQFKNTFFPTAKAVAA